MSHGTGGDFGSRAAAAAARALSQAGQDNPAEVLARSLAADAVKISDAARAYASLVAARSMTAAVAEAASAAGADAEGEPRALFAGSGNPARSGLLCARALLALVNSTEIPPPVAGEGTDAGKVSGTGADEMEEDVVRIVWNSLVGKAAEDRWGMARPSKVLGRRCLVRAYPHVLGRLGEGGKLLPADVDREEALTFFREFGTLLGDADGQLHAPGPDDSDDDSALLWAADGGAAELKRRADRRMRKGKAAAEARADARGVADAAAAIGEHHAPAGMHRSSTVTIEEIKDDEEGS